MWTRSVVSKCGWAFSWVTRPWVAQRVWPMPVPGTGRSASATAPPPAVIVVAAAGRDRVAQRAQVADGANRIDPVAVSTEMPALS